MRKETEPKALALVVCFILVIWTVETIRDTSEWR